ISVNPISLDRNRRFPQPLIRNLRVNGRFFRNSRRVLLVPGELRKLGDDEVSRVEAPALPAAEAWAFETGRSVKHTTAEMGIAADQQIAADAELLSAQLAALRGRLFPPSAQKSLRPFTSGEA